MYIHWQQILTITVSSSWRSNFWTALKDAETYRHVHVLIFFIINYQISMKLVDFNKNTNQLFGLVWVIQHDTIAQLFSINIYGQCRAQNVCSGKCSINEYLSSLRQCQNEEKYGKDTEYRQPVVSQSWKFVHYSTHYCFYIHHLYWHITTMVTLITFHYHKTWFAKVQFSQIMRKKTNGEKNKSSFLVYICWSCCWTGCCSLEIHVHWTFRFLALAVGWLPQGENELKKMAYLIVWLL